LKFPMASETPIWPGPDRRAEPRLTCNNTPVELTIIQSGVVSVRTIPAIIVDASKSGLRLVADTRTRPGEQVRIKMERLIIFGEVRHCHAQGAMFVSGVKISDVVGERGLCNRLTDEQIELLALRRGLSAKERMYASYHVRHCESCAEQFRATKTFFAKVRCA
jgi:hypothetical protein